MQKLSFLLAKIHKWGRHRPSVFHGKQVIRKLLKLFLCTKTTLIERETGEFHTSFLEPWAWRLSLSDWKAKPMKEVVATITCSSRMRKQGCLHYCHCSSSCWYCSAFINFLDLESIQIINRLRLSLLYLSVNNYFTPVSCPTGNSSDRQTFIQARHKFHS